MGLREYRVTSTEAVPQGRAQLRFEFEPTGKPDFAHARGVPGRAQLYLNGRLVASVEFDTTVPAVFSAEGMSCGYDFGEAVTRDYQPPFRFTGTIHQVTLDVSGELIKDEESEVRRIMSLQ
jgi:arylsulfatase